MVIGISGLELRQNPWLFHSSSSSSSSSSSFQIIQKSRNLNTVTSSYKQQRRKPPLFVSTKPSDINLHDLTDLFTLCNHSCYRFPEIDSNGEVNAVDIDKLKIALSHSAVVVSVFCNPNLVSSSGVEFDDFLNRLVPVTQLNGKLVGFGRAISDLGLTASIHDIMFLPG